MDKNIRAIQQTYFLALFCTLVTVSAGVSRDLHSNCGDVGLSSTTLELPGKCLELGGRPGRRPNMAVNISIRRTNGARCRRPGGTVC